MYTAQFVYCGRPATLSIDDILPLHGILKDAIICNAEHHARRHWCPSAGASSDYAIVISRNPDSGTSAGASRDYAIVISHNPDSGVRAGSTSRQRKAAMNDDQVDDARHSPVSLLLRQWRPLLSTSDPHHLIYVG
ncbi:uncharacterized protein [Miscanthus floridulus]|uniref:uncharacterized protein n=1 Tax=Miscanthus floridulus TaxID=154761 RepID=UPI00345B2765